VQPCRLSLGVFILGGQANPDVQFQEIIYDGLLGDRFLRNFIVTYDLPRSRMIFTLPG
jgi:hypothetical protein